MPESAGPGTTAMRICGLLGAHCASRAMEIELRLQERSPGPAHQPDAASESLRGWSSKPISGARSVAAVISISARASFELI